jgi:uncharacterized membrane protein
MVKKNKVLFLTQFSILLAIEAVVCFTPLGSLPAIGPIVATLSHIPVIVTAIMLGTAAGAGMGFFFGLFSFIVWTFMPPSPVVAFVFTPVYSLGDFHGNFLSLVICFVPRILIGVVTGAVYTFFSKRSVKDIFTLGLSGILGSLTNTLLVLAGIYFFFGKSYAASVGVSYNLLLGIVGTTILTSGIPEAFLGGLAGYGICKPLLKLFKHRNTP